MRDRGPSFSVIIATQYANVGPGAAWPMPLCPTPVILHIQALRCARMTGDLVDTLPERWIGIRYEASTYTIVGSLKVLAFIIADVVTTRGNGHVHAVAAADNRVQTKTALTGLPMPRVIVVADAFY